MQLKQQFGYFDGHLSYEEKYEAESKALAKGWVLQNAYDRKLTYSELLRNSLEAELRLG
jgi:hypothetical protein